MARMVRQGHSVTPGQRRRKPARSSACIALASVHPRLSGHITLCHADPEDHILSVIRRTGRFYEADLLESLARRLRPGDLVLDVGANIGNHALFFAVICGCRVLAIEPDPLAFALLGENIAANGMQGRISALNIALGAEEGEGHMVHPDPHNLGASSVVAGPGGTIPIRRLDSLPRMRRLRLVKMDVENAEPLVLAGGRKLLESRQCPVFTAEAATREGFLRVEALLGDSGYVATETHAATPTHIFEWMKPSSTHSLLRAMGRNAALHAIALHSLRTQTRRDMTSLQAALAKR